MKFVLKYFRENKILFFSAIFYLLIRLILLDHAFLLRGERDIALTGYFLANSGKDLYGNFFPLEFFGVDMPTPFLTFYYSALWWIIVPIKNVFFARFPYVIATTTYIFLVYEIVKEVSKNKKLALVTSLVFAFSPGIYHLSRLALEVNIATPILLTSILLYLKKYRIQAYVLLVLVYFSYNGFRPILLPLIVYLEFYHYLHGEKLKSALKKAVIALIFFVTIAGISTFFVDGDLTFSRKDDLVFFSTEEISNEVIYKRNTSLAPLILDKIFSNKATEIGDYMIKVFVQGLGMRYLFTKGDPAAIYSSAFSGQFFLIMLPMYYLGLAFLARKWDKKHLYILGFIPVGLIPAVINIDYVSYTIRSILSTFGYAYIISGGIVFGYQMITEQNKLIKNTLISLILLVLFTEVSYFTYNYFFRRQKTMFEFYFESEKDLANYIIDSDKKYFIYDDSPRNILATYYFQRSKIDVGEAQQLFKNEQPYNTDKLILRSCPGTDEKLVLKPNTIVAESCLNLTQYDEFIKSEKVNTIDYEDYSFKSAYFIINDEVPEFSTI